MYNLSIHHVCYCVQSNVNTNNVSFTICVTTVVMQAPVCKEQTITLLDFFNSEIYTSCCTEIYQQNTQLSEHTEEFLN